MKERLAFLLNLDAEIELSDPSYARSDRMRRAIRERARWLLPRIRAATDTDPILIDDDRPDLGWPPPARADAWCPTPRALARLRALGLPPPDAPPADVLRTVNHRAFTVPLGIALPRARFVTTLVDCLQALAIAPDDLWLLKRPLGFSGRMRKVIIPRHLDTAARTWIAASMTAYGRGLMVEPLVERVLDCSLHGRLARDGSVERGQPVVVDCDHDGAFVDARRAAAGELDDVEVEALVAAFDAVVDRLRIAGWFGPFGIDAFRWRDGDGEHFHPLVELNARYTMAWWTGMGRA